MQYATTVILFFFLFKMARWVPRLSGRVGRLIIFGEYLIVIYIVKVVVRMLESLGGIELGDRWYP